GAAFVAAVLARLATLGFKGSVCELRLPFEAAGPSALHVRDPGQCRALLERMLNAAPTLELPPVRQDSDPAANPLGSTLSSSLVRQDPDPASKPAKSTSQTESPKQAGSESCPTERAPSAADGPCPPPAPTPAVQTPPAPRLPAPRLPAPAPRWLSPGRIPLGKVTMLDADPGLG